MPVDSVSEIGAPPASVDLNSGNTSGRRRMRRTTGQLSDRSASTIQRPPSEAQQPPAIGAAVAPPATMLSPLMADGLESLADDITDVPAGDSGLPPLRHAPKPTRAVAPLPSVDKDRPAAEPGFFYVQRPSGFKKTRGWPAMFQAKRAGAPTATADKEQLAAEELRRANNELLEVGVVVQRVEQKMGVFVCGCLAGLTIWYAVAAQLLFAHLVEDSGGRLATFVGFYQPMSLPVACALYALLACCLLAVLDRYDLGFGSRATWLRAVRFQNAALSLMLLYTAALVVTLVCFQYDARIYRATSDKMQTNDEPLKATSSTPLLPTTSLASSLLPTSTETTTAGLLVFQRSTSTSARVLLISGDELAAALGKSDDEVADEEPFDMAELRSSLRLWLGLGFARAACCTLAWLVLVITSDEDHLVAYLQSLMEQTNKPQLPRTDVATVSAGSKPAVTLAEAAPPAANVDPLETAVNAP